MSPNEAVLTLSRAARWCRGRPRRCQDGTPWACEGQRVMVKPCKRGWLSRGTPTAGRRAMGAGIWGPLTWLGALQRLQVDDVPLVEAELGAVLRAVIPDGHHVLGVLGTRRGWHSPHMRARPWGCMNTHGNSCTPEEIHADPWKFMQTQGNPCTPEEIHAHPCTRASSTPSLRATPGCQPHQALLPAVPCCPPQSREVPPTFLSSVMNWSTMALTCGALGEKRMSFSLLRLNSSMFLDGVVTKSTSA